MDWFLYDRNICHEGVKLFKHNLLATLHLNFGRHRNKARLNILGGVKHFNFLTKLRQNFKKKLIFGAVLLTFSENWKTGWGREVTTVVGNAAT